MKFDRADLIIECTSPEVSTGRTTSISSTSSSLSPTDRCQSGYYSPEEDPKVEAMIRIEGGQYQPIQIDPSFLEFRTTSSSDLSSPTDQISASSGESGFFDSSYTDLQEFFDSQNQPTIQHHQQPQQPQLPLQVDHDHLHQQEEHLVLTPAGTPDDERLQWAYLEPVKLNESEQILIRHSTNQLHLAPDTCQESNLNLQLLPSTSGLSPTSWSQEDPGGVVIKSEPLPLTNSFDSSLSGYAEGLKQEAIDHPGFYNVSQLDEHFNEPQVSRAKRGSKSILDASANRLCHVCGETAGKHSYYGGQVCPSCRAFFRRSVQSKYSDVYACSKNKDCVITLKTRKNCQFCRFKMCERAGMKRSWVLADGERKNSGKKRVLEKLPTEPVVPLHPDESGTIARLVDTMVRSKSNIGCMNTSKLCSDFAELIKDRRSTVSPEVRFRLHAVLDSNLRRFANSLPEFTSLSSQDKISLLEQNKKLVFVLALAHFLYPPQPEVTWRKQLQVFLDKESISNVLPLVGEKPADKKTLVSCNQLFARPDDDHELRKIANTIEDDSCFCLLVLMLLFNLSFVNVMARSDIDAKQLFFSTLLQRYLQSVHGRSKARAKLAAAFMIISKCMTLSEQL